MLSVLIPTLNESRNIRACLGSVSWADDLVVVDSGSTDGTRELATSCGARVVDFHWDGKGPKKKNWALRTVDWKNDWVLVLDADERITTALAAEILQVLEIPDADGYFINRRFMFMGKWIRHCGYNPSWNLRLFRHSQGEYEHVAVGDAGSGDNEVHEHVVLQGCTAYLRQEMLHLAYPDLFTWIEKHNRYSNWEAALEVDQPQVQAEIGPRLSRKRRLKAWSRRLPCRPLARFLYSFVLKGGFLDGYEGYVLCRLLALYELLSQFKARELRTKGHQSRK